MKTLKRTIAKGLLGLLFISISVSANAQTAPVPAPPTPAPAKGSFSFTADLVSSYVWRGIAQEGSKGGSPNFQPSLTYTIGKLSLGAWGSGSFSGKVKEVDLSATYAFNDVFSVGITDYNWNFTKSYFNYNNDSTDHIFEASLNYAGVKSFPLSISLNTMFLGDDKKISTSGTVENEYSTYVELGYPLADNTKLFLGASVFDSPGLYTVGKSQGFSVINVGLKTSKNIKFSESFSLPVYGVLGFNPQAETAYFVVGMTF